eukprot:CAMPEP_0202862740 /NCGR_PEP_ID=MMETSP1391-20130828/3672_1 /ASSEMBLY_ACC=CAM_ASM_000867 /TAXON_ID=1034604 /ORGANISM="Chlamydomonas leiostraca, Strain SAG 11-49" /LENGTH=254 /DNA_ID=CAMNT_0049542315 /DNA_START=101 /DNA_END=865 /DNA_ORIENTATION=-
MEVSEQELQGLYTWVDEIPLSRPKRNIARDFSDGVLMAEIVHHYFPKMVELHNYSSANGTTQKLYNWNTLNNKVFKRMGFTIAKQDFEAVSNCQPGAIERVLKLVKGKVAKFREEGFTGSPVAPTVPSAAYAHPGAMMAQQQAGMGGGYGMGGGQQGGPLGPMNSGVGARAGQGPVMGAIPPGGGRLLGGGMPLGGMAGGVHPEVLAEKEQAIAELRETNEILETKVRKLEQLVRLKDAKISTLMAKLQAAGLA